MLKVMRIQRHVFGLYSNKGQPFLKNPGFFEKVWDFEKT